MDFDGFCMDFAHLFHTVYTVVLRRMVHLNNDAVQKQGEESLGSTRRRSVSSFLGKLSFVHLC